MSAPLGPETGGGKRASGFRDNLNSGGGGGEGAELLKDRPGPNHMLQANRHNPDLSLRRGVPRELPMDTY